jgi:hypothetical protein
MWPSIPWRGRDQIIRVVRYAHTHSRTVGLFLGMGSVGVSGRSRRRGAGEREPGEPVDPADDAAARPQGAARRRDEDGLGASGQEAHRAGGWRAGAAQRQGAGALHRLAAAHRRDVLHDEGQQSADGARRRACSPGVQRGGAAASQGREGSRVGAAWPGHLGDAVYEVEVVDIVPPPAVAKRG